MMKHEIELPTEGLPSGREVTGVRWAKPKSGDYWLMNNGKWDLSEDDWPFANKLIADLAEVWRPATVEDAIRALRGEDIRCRVRDAKTDNWIEAHLRGYATGHNFPWVIEGGYHYKYCEVLEECK